VFVLVLGTPMSLAVFANWVRIHMLPCEECVLLSSCATELSRDDAHCYVVDVEVLCE
jgi:hypothetical protein